MIARWLRRIAVLLLLATGGIAAALWHSLPPGSHSAAIPGHDPDVLRRFPALPGDPNTVQLHLEPSK